MVHVAGMANVLQVQMAKHGAIAKRVYLGQHATKSNNVKKAVVVMVVAFEANVYVKSDTKDLCVRRKRHAQSPRQAKFAVAMVHATLANAFAMLGTS
jgi:hypothetical protein